MRWQFKLDDPTIEPQVSPRPHWITIVIGILGPFATILALGIAYSSFQTATYSLKLSQDSVKISERSLQVSEKSLETSQASLKTSQGSLEASNKSLETSQKSLELSRQSVQISQRAYLSITEAKFPLNAVKPNSSIYQSVADFKVSNTGNSHAHIEQVVLQYIVPEGWRPNRGVVGSAPLVNRYREFRYGVARNIDLGPHASQHLQFEIYFDLMGPTLRDHIQSTVQTMNDPLMMMRPRTMVAKGWVSYVDVFDAKHETHWCWSPGEEMALLSNRCEGMMTVDRTRF